MDTNTEMQAVDRDIAVKEVWNRPVSRTLDAKDAELGLGVGADLVILGTSS